MATSINLSTTTTSEGIEEQEELNMDEEQSLRECEAYVQKHDIQKILKVLFFIIFLFLKGEIEVNN